MLLKMNTQEQDFISTVFLSLDSKEKEETQQEQIEFLDFIEKTPLSTKVLKEMGTKNKEKIKEYTSNNFLHFLNIKTNPDYSDLTPELTEGVSPHHATLTSTFLTKLQNSYYALSGRMDLRNLWELTKAGATEFVKTGSIIKAFEQFSLEMILRNYFQIFSKEKKEAMRKNQIGFFGYLFPPLAAPFFIVGLAIGVTAVINYGLAQIPIAIYNRVVKTEEERGFGHKVAVGISALIFSPTLAIFLALAAISLVIIAAIKLTALILTAVFSPIIAIVHGISLAVKKHQLKNLANELLGKDADPEDLKNVQLTVSTHTQASDSLNNKTTTKFIFKRIAKRSEPTQLETKTAQDNTLTDNATKQPLLNQSVAPSEAEITLNLTDEAKINTRNDFLTFFPRNVKIEQQPIDNNTPKKSSAI